MGADLLLTPEWPQGTGATLDPQDPSPNALAALGVRKFLPRALALAWVFVAISDGALFIILPICRFDCCYVLASSA